MNECGRLLLVASCVLLSGCSGYLTSWHFEVVNDGTLVRYQIHDWYEEETTGPSAGAFRPPVYGFEHAGQTYAVYPVFIRTGVAVVGPPVVPLLPVSSDQDDSMILKIRHRSTAGELILPTTVRVGDAATSTVRLEPSKSDAVGTVFSTRLAIPESTERFALTLALSDGSVRRVLFARRRDRMYSPFFSFNGPEPRPSFERYPQ